jgi:hypothetical protein
MQDYVNNTLIHWLPVLMQTLANYLISIPTNLIKHHVRLGNFLLNIILVIYMLESLVQSLSTFNYCLMERNAYYDDHWITGNQGRETNSPCWLSGGSTWICCDLRRKMRKRRKRRRDAGETCSYCRPGPGQRGQASPHPGRPLHPAGCLQGCTWGRGEGLMGQFRGSDDIPP